MRSYVCIADCPELDLDNQSHCIHVLGGDSPGSMLACPCGNTPLWKPVDEIESYYDDEGE